MSDSEVDTGDSVRPGKPVIVDRYTVGARINHWITAISLVLLALSGLALFSPSLYFLTGLFGGGQLTRVLHPWIGVVLFFSFMGLFFRFFRLNLWKRTDSVWLSRLRDVLAGDEGKLPEVGKYNAGQKMVFWSMSLLIILLIVSGIVSWDEYFASYFSIEQRRIAVLVHAGAAVAAICVWIVHVYAGIWVRGTISAMTRGQVTGGWAWRHHRKWLKDLVTTTKR
ncbi:gamma subunit of formate dehydrogenase [Afipia carboxidovorans OM5]|uniref:Formate dehydrogenase, gamma subunit n=1 Tax=Afipia carboxidovorans (strain ATCC 49405 / DSM 1227 / KCTC 32145 / OM5) TaxID=504832 RepID=B6JC78_AFIC5|nr:formate dehydrogenase subunit gamma [Afipia carboxidovorans]ACI92294.1 gamma subunit of formate dehydrogenase [Afipia carboxidovorans OM5]AEI03923.1 formate dehydrogenase, gamma subunit [Afipia carboxidovorans OM4]AEI07500.1 formate dehydrogenase, gamma subunit [Afipia carboxidovorans OM5]BEV45046.1 formate dehydrogenase subunit gamma [Afipia carboxidovorans]